MHNHHLRVLGVAFARVVPSCQLLVEEAAEDVSALSYSCRGFVQEVSGSEDEGGDRQTQHIQSWFSFPQAGLRTQSLSPLNSLEIEIYNDVVEVLPTVEALQVLGCDGDPAFQRRRGKLD